MMQDGLTIDERMKRIHTRIQLEKISGISAATERDQFVNFCERWEQSDVAIHAPDDGQSHEWRNFDKWNDAPIYVFKQRKAEAR